MLPSLTTTSDTAKPIHTVAVDAFERWLGDQPPRVGAWLTGSGFEPKPGRCALLPGEDGAPAAALLVRGGSLDVWDVAALAKGLPAGDWRFDAGPDAPPSGLAAEAFALASYRFERYRKAEPRRVRLVVEDTPEVRRAAVVGEAVVFARDLINTPAADLGPAELADAVHGVAERFDADVRTIEGDDLLAEGYPAVHAVGRASSRPPRIVDLRWGEASAPRVTLVGKGVCFDTGGLDIKPSSGMALMKKDMGGAAVTLGLARAVMAQALPVRLRLLIGAVENSVGSRSFRPGDVLATRKGLTVEVGNTDAEGRLVLADLLAEGERDQPALMIDCATLTGAARVALGPDLPALFTPDDDLAELLLAAGRDVADPLWRLPLHAPYRRMIETPIADLNNAGRGGFAGAITAALFLQTFVGERTPWAHLDIYAWNPDDRPGRPKGGEASALRALLAALERRFAG